jgi:signal transduction histidine kinase/ActR/RegA family two-component response regulator
MKALFDVDRFMPHGHCFQWEPGILWSNVTSDALIAVAYMVIPFTLVFQIMRKRDLPFNWMFFCFGAFIVACGATHIMDIIVIWIPLYGLAAAVKAVTALASVPTAIILYRIAPTIVKLPSVQEMVDEQALRLRAEAANEAKDRFIAILSHELRTPLTPVKAGLEILDQELRKIDGAVNTSNVQETLRMVRANVDMERVLIDDLLDLSALRHGKLQLEACPVDFHRLCRETARSFESEFARKQIRLVLDLATEKISVLGEPARLQQILNNLLSNALKHTSAGGEVHVSLSRVREQARVSVQDSGSGIASKDQERIFLPFEQLERKGELARAGLGLGLSIARALAEAMNGHVTVESEGHGCGATFILELPVTSRTDVPPVPAAFQSPPDANSQPRLLLVDDHPDTLRTLSELLRRAGYELATAENLAQAEPLLSQCEVLVTDISLPDGDGCELMRRFKARGGRVGVAVTGFGQPEDIRRYQEAGFQRHLVKPIEFQRLLEAIRNAVAVAEVDRREHQPAEL